MLTTAAGNEKVGVSVGVDVWVMVAVSVGVDVGVALAVLVRVFAMVVCGAGAVVKSGGGDTVFCAATPPEGVAALLLHAARVGMQKKQKQNQMRYFIISLYNHLIVNFSYYLLFCWLTGCKKELMLS